MRFDLKPSLKILAILLSTIALCDVAMGDQRACDVDAQAHAVWLLLSDDSVTSTAGIGIANWALQSDSAAPSGESSDVVTKHKLRTIGIVGLGLFLLLVVLFGYLKLNLATRGFYSRRLQLGAFLAAVVIVLLCYGIFVATG